MSNEIVIRRSANYHSPIWDYSFVQSLKNEFVGESYIKRINQLKESVKTMLTGVVIPLDQLELIDTLQRLGLAYHFEDEINKILNSIYNQNPYEKSWANEDLHGYNISQEIFNFFLDDLGNFKTCIVEDLQGLLSLYEASYLSEEGENILEVARKFATICLQKYTTLQDKDPFLSMIISHSLELPLHWSVPRLETRWFIEVYERKEGTNPLLLELAKLDFNNARAIH
ncbi:(R)-limonene synthase, putative [Ricinus communis]|uniref:(R)-limonene synthase, putative n=1 Tax=Ricinus communis TaxID=3988 RepID=B9S899_RICCO|nr:(R)-limonene synthase, putative [Ricinus communis]